MTVLVDRLFLTKLPNQCRQIEYSILSIADCFSTQYNFPIFQPSPVGLLSQAAAWQGTICDKAVAECLNSTNSPYMPLFENQNIEI